VHLQNDWYKETNRRVHILANIIEKEPLPEIKCVISFTLGFLQQFCPQKYGEFAMGGSRVQPSVIKLRMSVLLLYPGEKFLVALFVQLFELARDQVQGFPEDI